jgi:hypothetical protein
VELDVIAGFALGMKRQWKARLGRAEGEETVANGGSGVSRQTIFWEPVTLFFWVDYSLYCIHPRCRSECDCWSNSGVPT